MSKNGVTCKVLKNYVENRDLILDSFSNDRKSVKELFLTILRHYTLCIFYFKWWI